MSRTKAKRIVWTIAALLALTLVAAMVLHKHEEPKVIGNLSKEDVAEILKSFDNYKRTELRVFAEYDLRHGQVREMISLVKSYLHSHVEYVEAIDGADVRVIVGPNTNDWANAFDLLRTGDGWRVGPAPLPPLPLPPDNSTTPPVSNSAVGK